jgi:hypothetical protein
MAATLHVGVCSHCCFISIIFPLVVCISFIRYPTFGIENTFFPIKFILVVEIPSDALFASPFVSSPSSVIFITL